ncbi:MAG: PHP domain-containing protein [Clostridia bacterium]|nr:PHP domain-containing protein [Clostridia bacterium]
MKPFDLHIHSHMSDGTFAPNELPSMAMEKGVELMALTDHDTAAGCKEAVDAGAGTGVKVICGMEIDAEFPSELHILALGIDPEHPDILRYEQWRKGEREDRNGRILAKLKSMGIDAEPFMEHSKGNDTRLHIAKALVTGGWAVSLKDAFDRYIGSGAPAYQPSKRISKRDAVELARSAGGVAVLAHPCKLKADPYSLVRELADYGLWGIEAFYPISTEGQRKMFLSIAGQYGLIPTCGSDFHGKNREVFIGDAYYGAEELRPAYEYFLACP